MKRMTIAASSSSGDGSNLMTVRPKVHKSQTSNTRNVDIKTGLKVATWNVLTLNWTGYVTVLVRMLKERKLFLTGVTEARLLGSGSTVVEGVSVLHSRECHHVNHVALVVCGPLTSCLTHWSPISDRLLLARFSHRYGHLSVVVTYAPTEDSPDEVKDDFYGQLDATISYTLLVLGDSNATTGKGRGGFKSVVGSFGSGDDALNDNSLRMLSLCASAGLTVIGSWFRRRDIHQWSWYSNDGRTRKEIDDILVRQSDRGLVTNCNIYRECEAPASTDHCLLVATIKMQIPFFRPATASSKHLRADRLRSDILLSRHYNLDVKNFFDALGTLDADVVETSWEKLSGEKLRMPQTQSLDASGK